MKGTISLCVLTLTFFIISAAFAGRNYNCPYPVTVKLDGNLDDWSRVGVDKGVSPDDPDPSWRLAAVADDEWLYVAVDIRDDVIKTGETDDWNDDSVEIYIDANHARTETYENDDVQITIPAVNIELKDIQNPKLLGSGGGAETGTQAAVVKTATGWLVETAIPLKNNKWDIKPVYGKVIGFNVHLNDDDDGGGMDHKSSWSDLDMDGTSWQNPSRFGDLIFGKSIITSEYQFNRVRRRASEQMFFTGVPLAFAILHLLLFLFYPRSKGNLYYALFTGLFAAAAFIDYQKNINSDLAMLERVFAISVGVSGIRFAYSIAYKKLPKQFFFFVIKREYIPQIYCYPNQLNQVFMHLFINAAESIEDKGTIGVKAFSDDTKVYVNISDTGKGIPLDNLNRIFDPGFTTKSSGVGTGLGLSISYNIIHQEHSGEIKVESEIGKGTEFTIALPTNPNRQNQRGI